MARQATKTIYAASHVSKRPPQDTTMLLTWLKSHGVSKNKFGRKIGCAPRMIDWWCSGRSVPGLIYAFIIEKATEGGVSVEMWLGTEIGKQLWREQIGKGEMDL